MAHPHARPFVVYYGWLTDGPHGEPNTDAQRIAAAAPPLLIAQPWTAAPAGHRNLSAPVLKLVHDAGTEIYAYLATGFGQRVMREVLDAMDDGAAQGVDGVFFDEVDPLCGETHLAYYRALSSAARATGLGVIVNTGVARCGERVMEIADRMMVEHQWRELCRQSLWTRRYGRERFMGISSNEDNAMGYVVDRARAAADAREAWEAGIGWHGATDRYTTLPEWL